MQISGRVKRYQCQAYRDGVLVNTRTDAFSNAQTCPLGVTFDDRIGLRPSDAQKIIDAWHASQHRQTVGPPMRYVYSLVLTDENVTF